MSEAPASSLDALLFRALMEKSADAIYFKDTQSRYLRVSNRMVGSFNQDHPSQVEGKCDTEFFAADHAAETLRNEQAIMKSGLPQLNAEEVETWPDGSITWASTSRFPLYDGDGKLIGVFGISRDVTDQKIAQEQLELAQKNLIEQEKKSAVSEFAGMIVANMGSSTVEILQAVDRASQLLSSARNNPEALNNAQEELREIRHMAKRLGDLMKITGV